MPFQEHSLRRKKFRRLLILVIKSSEHGVGHPQNDSSNGDSQPKHDESYLAVKDCRENNEYSTIRQKAR